MRPWIFFETPLRPLGDVNDYDLTTMLTLSIAARRIAQDAHSRRLRECCVEHVRWMEGAK